MMKKILAILFIVLFSLVYIPTQTSAQSAEEIQRNIQDRSTQIEKLNKEIKELDGQITDISKQGKSLQNTIKSLDITQNKLSKDIQVTENNIAKTTLTITELNQNILSKKKRIQNNLNSIGATLRMLQQSDDVTLAESVLANQNISEFWDDVNALEKLQTDVKKNVDVLQALTLDLEKQEKSTEEKKRELTGFKAQLSDQKVVVENTKQEKASLLSETKNKESNYRKILDDKKKLAEQIEQEINQYEAQLKFIIDPNSYPKAGAGIIKWPLDKVIITQYFGDTAFSRTQAIYKGKGHNGIDLGASKGTPVKAALAGTIEGTGNTGLSPGCLSYGKWVLIRHNNGLSTLYAHLDLIKVAAGETVTTGQMIAYSGDTGYVTGPHLHFGVFASQGTKIIKFVSNTPCNNAIFPVADTKAYLNPINYL